MLLIWWEDMRWKKYGSHFISVMKSQRRRSLLKSAFYCWIHFTLDSLLIANAKSQTELLDAKVITPYNHFFFLLIKYISLFPTFYRTISKVSHEKYVCQTLTLLVFFSQIWII
jgi:hypothetical protein